jgi:hypothetical protein
LDLPVDLNLTPKKKQIRKQKDISKKRFRGKKKKQIESLKVAQLIPQNTRLEEIERQVCSYLVTHVRIGLLKG